jgi:diguanylate cyclase (GGDEF)-like protein
LFETQPTRGLPQKFQAPWGLSASVGATSNPRPLGINALQGDGSRLHSDERIEGRRAGFDLARWTRLPIGARAAVVIVVTVLLAVVAGAVVVTQLTDQMRREAEARLDRHTSDEAASLQDLMTSASQDIRLARRNEIFEKALADSTGALLAADRKEVEAAITYLGDRYQVDEICVIRSNGMEAARWVGGSGVAPVSDLSPDERQNNPAVLPTLPLPDDSFYQSQPYVSPDSNRWVIGIATPIVLDSGLHAGILHFEIPIQRFATEMAAMPFGGTSYSLVVDKTGRLIVHPRIAAFRSSQGLGTDPDTAAFPTAAGSGSSSWRQAVSQLLVGESGSASFDDSGTTYRMSYLPVQGSDRILAVVTPVGELYADVNRALLNLAVTAGPLVLLIVVVTGWFARRVSGANRRLAGLNSRLSTANERLEETSKTSSELAHESAIVNQFTELTALTEDDVSLSAATLATLDELLHPGDAALHVSNTSQDRAVPQATLGEREADVLSLHELGRCPGLRRSTLYVTTDVSARLSYRCPVYPVDKGTLACIPLVALGETVGAAHLHWPTTRELSLPLRLAITRVSEHAALSIANRRLLLALRGQANTDGRTGLTNSRAFDETVERILANRGDREPLAILMLDIDQFKEFNDRHGHPAGDEALRAFAHLLRACIREQDIAARYGGEEFAVCLPGTPAGAAQEVAERIRERTESTILPLAPGLTGHLTVSIGVANAPADGTERLTLLKVADDALYRAKLAGRNRVMSRQVQLNGQSARPAANTRKPQRSPRVTTA